MKTPAEHLAQILRNLDLPPIVHYARHIEEEMSKGPAFALLSKVADDIASEPAPLFLLAKMLEQHVLWMQTGEQEPSVEFFATIANVAALAGARIEMRKAREAMI